MLWIYFIWMLNCFPCRYPTLYLTIFEYCNLYLVDLLLYTERVFENLQWVKKYILHYPCFRFLVIWKIDAIFIFEHVISWLNKMETINLWHTISSPLYLCHFDFDFFFFPHAEKLNIFVILVSYKFICWLKFPLSLQALVKMLLIILCSLIVRMRRILVCCKLILKAWLWLGWMQCNEQILPLRIL